MIRLPYWVAATAIVALLAGAILVYLQFSRIAEDSKEIRELRSTVEMWEDGGEDSVSRFDAARGVTR